MALEQEGELARVQRASPIVWDLLRGKEAISAIHTTFTQPQSPFREMHQALEFGVLLYGRIRRFCEGTERVIEPGEAWFQGAWEPHAYQLLTLPTVALAFGVLPQVLIMAGFEDAPPYDWMAPFTASPEARPKTAPSKRRELLTLASKVISPRTSGSPDGRVRKRLLFFEMMLIAREGWTPPVSHQAPLHDLYDRISRAVGMVLASRRPVGLEEAAKACGMSRNAFSRLFRTSLGITFAKYCLRHRLSAAAEQLLHTDDPVKVVAAQWGFADASHFGQCFREHYGCPPAEYRRIGAAAQGDRQAW
jgi:AraC-like DNA-binding protein